MHTNVWTFSESVSSALHFCILVSGQHSNTHNSAFFYSFLLSSYRLISSIRGELVPYLVRKQFSKTANHQKPKDDAEGEKKQKKSDGSTNHGQCLHQFGFDIR